MAISGQVPFICECADERCTKIVRISLDRYEDVRSQPRRFFNAPGHQALSVSAGAAVVIENLPGYVVVDKIEIAGEIAEKRYDQLSERQNDE
jgi:hypothetical protein